MYQNPIYMCISWCSKICWFPMKICWCQQNSRDVSRGLYIFWIFLKQGISVPSFIIAEYVRRILGTGGQKGPPPLIREQPRKSPSWIGLKMFHISKQYVAIIMQIKHLLYVNTLDIIWSSFLLISIDKFLRKRVLGRKSLFHLFWHCFVTLSYKR